MAASNDSTIGGNLLVKGNARFGSLTIPPASLTGEGVAPDAGIPASAIEHQYPLVYRQEGTVVAATVPIHITRGAGEIIGIKATVLTHATGADRALTVDLKAGSNGVAMATQLTGVITIDELAANLQVFEGTLIVDPSYAADETLELVIAVAGAAGAQAIGLIVEVMVRENADV